MDFAAKAVIGVALVGAGALAYRALSPASSSPAASSGEEEGTLQQLVGLVGAYTAGAMSPEVLRQKIANYERMLRTPGVHQAFPGPVWYQNEIAKMKARLVALEGSQQRSAVWTSLGQTGTAVAIVAGISLAAYLGIRAIQEAKE